MEREILCPRDGGTLRTSAVARADRHGTFSIDGCADCGGVWYDGADLPAASPHLGALASQREWIVAHAIRDGAEPFECPRCRDGMLRFPCFDLRLDYCARCDGVWFDRGELERLAGALTQGAGYVAPAGGPATDAARAHSTGVVPCASCRKDVAVARSLLTGDGPMCGDCGEAYAARCDTGSENALAGADAWADVARSRRRWNAAGAVFGALVGIGHAVIVTGKILGGFAAPTGKK